MLRLWDLSMLQDDPEGEVELPQQASRLYSMSLNSRSCCLLLVAARIFAEFLVINLCEVNGRMEELEAWKKENSAG